MEKAIKILEELAELSKKMSQREGTFFGKGYYLGMTAGHREAIMVLKAEEEERRDENAENNG